MWIYIKMQCLTKHTVTHTIEKWTPERERERVPDTERCKSDFCSVAECASRSTFLYIRECVCVQCTSRMHHHAGSFGSISLLLLFFGSLTSNRFNFNWTKDDDDDNDLLRIGLFLLIFVRMFDFFLNAQRYSSSILYCFEVVWMFAWVNLSMGKINSC